MRNHWLRRGKKRLQAPARTPKGVDPGDLLRAAAPHNLVLRRRSSAHRAALVFKFFSCQGQRTSNRRDHPFWSALDFRTRSAEGFVILPSARHVSMMTPFLFKTLAIGTILANLREIAKAQRTDRYQNVYPVIAREFPHTPSSEIAHTGPARSDSLPPAK